jgi:hypothetical protein
VAIFDQPPTSATSAQLKQGRNRLKIGSNHTTQQDGINMTFRPPQAYTATLNPVLLSVSSAPLTRRLFSSNYSRRPAEPAKKGGRFSLSPSTIAAIAKSQRGRENTMDLDNDDDLINKKPAQDRSQIEANYLKTKQQLQAAEENVQFRLERIEQWSTQKQDVEKQLQEGSSLHPDRKKTLEFHYQVFSKAHSTESLEHYACVRGVNRLKFANNKAEQLYREVC